MVGYGNFIEHIKKITTFIVHIKRENNMLRFDKHGYLMPYNIIDTDLNTFERYFEG
jgi:hypothetical protein